MFLQLLNKDEQETFLSLAYELIKIDGEIDKKELEKIKNLSLEIYGNNDFSFKPFESFENINHLFESKASKKACLIELIGLCYVDGEYCEKEQAFIKKISNSFKIDTNDLSELENWVKNLVNLTIEGINLINK